MSEERGTTWTSSIVRHGASVLLWVALALLVHGLREPVLRVEKFWFFENTVSIWSGTWSLIGEGEVFLGGIVLVFSILFPVAKNLMLIAVLHFYAWLEPYSRTLVRVVAVLGKWSMLDVFLLALIVSSVKLGALAKAEVRSGVYYFAISILITNAISTVLDWTMHRSRSS